MVDVLDQVTGKNFTAINGDCCESILSIPDESVGFSIYSPPFSQLYSYSDSERDMSNCGTDEEFFAHYGFLLRELYRVIKPGRLMSIHCMNLPSMLSRHGQIGVIDFRGDCIRAAQKAGFIFHSEICIWKDPVLQMQRTKALGLLHKQVCKDSAMSRQGIPDYVVTMRKPGKNPDPVAGPFTYFAGEEFESTGNPSIDIWQRYASPVWMDIRQSRTLNVQEARSEKDERHVCPLQLDVIERCMQLWSNPGDVVLSPFMGIGSEGVVSLQMGRKFVGFELKPEYFQVAVKNLRNEERKAGQPKLFDDSELLSV